MADTSDNSASINQLKPYRRVGRRNIILRNALPIFVRIFRGVACCVVELNAGFFLGFGSRAKK